jgi:hypothetical protein
MVHAFRLIVATGWIEDAPRLWAAVDRHDLARTHDGPESSRRVTNTSPCFGPKR